MKSISTVLLFCLISLILLFIFPLLLVFVFFPFYVYRQLIKTVAHILYRNAGLGKMVTTRANIITVDKIHADPKCNLLVCLTLKGKVDISHFKKTFFLNTVELKQKDSTFPWYPELKQYLFHFGGYSFWRNDEAFNIDDHIYFHKDFEFADRVTDEDLHIVRRNLIHKPWRENKPLWEIIFLDNFYSTENSIPQGPLSVCFFRIHHSLADGVSILTLLAKNVLKADRLEFPNAKYVRKNIVRRIFDTLTFPLRGAYALAKIVRVGTHSPWMIAESKQTTTVQCLSPLISLQMVKDIKDHFKVSFSSVILAAVSGAHREILIKKKIPVPRVLKCFCPFPLPNHSGKLRNYVTVVIADLPLRKETPVKRLLACNKMYENFRTTAEPFVFSLMAMLMGVIPRGVIRRIMGDTISTGITVFPAGPKTYNFSDGVNDVTVVDISLCGGLLVGTTGAGFCIISYKDGIRVLGGAYDTLMTQDEVNSFTCEVARQIESLHQHVV